MIIEKVNKFHPDKVADRIAGCIVDYAYTKSDTPKVAVEVLIGHGECNIIVETSEKLRKDIITEFVCNIDKSIKMVNTTIVKQDKKLAKAQKKEIVCGDNGHFFVSREGLEEYNLFTNALKQSILSSDGKYIWNKDKSELIACQSGKTEDIESEVIEIAQKLGVKNIILNPLGEWTGGTAVDTGVTNRKLGSDQNTTNPNGLHGKDLSKTDVSLTIYLNYLLDKDKDTYAIEAYCSIGSKEVEIITYDKKKHTKTEQVAMQTIHDTAKNIIYSKYGSFRRFAEWGF